MESGTARQNKQVVKIDLKHIYKNRQIKDYKSILIYFKGGEKT